MDATVVQELRGQVALAHRLLAHYALGAYQGHVSARVPSENLLIIRANPAVALSRTQPEDLMILDFDGNVVEAADSYPDRVAGWAVHTEIYKARPEIMAVTHTHQKWCSVFGIAGRDVLPVLHPPTASIVSPTSTSACVGCLASIVTQWLMSLTIPKPLISNVAGMRMVSPDSVVNWLFSESLPEMNGVRYAMPAS